MKTMKYCLVFVIYCSLASCFSSSKPMDPSTRQAIDSISNAEIARIQTEMDSLCKLHRITDMPRLIDSVKQQRLKQIQEQLRNVAK